MSKPSPGVDRRSLFALTGGLAAASAGLSLGPSQAQAELADASLKVATAVEGTNIAARLSPDGGSIAFDLFGILWIIPSQGGAARRLTADGLEIC